MNYFKKEIECAPRHELEALQSYRLSQQIRRVYDNVKPYREKMDAAGVKPEDIKTIADLHKLPFTTKQDLRDNYPYGMFATPTSEIVRIHASSGTTGKQTVVGYTQNDIDLWAECAARALASCGGDNNDFVHVSYGYGLFTGGLGMHYGAEKLGATTIPASAGNSQRQLEMFRDFGSTIVCMTPSYAISLIELMNEIGMSKDDLKLKAGIFGAEPWSEEMRKEIEAGLGIKAYDIYGLTETAGPGVAMECIEGREGLHMWEDFFLPEIVDPETGEPLPDGEMGELVITTICKEGMPTVRFRTHDLTRIISEPCKCGRTIRRIDRISSRSDDMFIIRGVNVFPSQIESALLAIEGTTPNYRIILYTENGMDNIQVDAELRPDMISSDIEKMTRIHKRITASIESVTGLRVKLKLVDPNTITRSEGKAKRVFDQRVK